MSLQLIPHALALLLSVGAFAVAWLAGLACDVPLDAIALRAAAGAAVFWLIGLIVGKVFVGGVCAAVGEHLADQQRKNGG
jgi:hypothetical protein